VPSSSFTPGANVTGDIPTTLTLSPIRNLLLILYPTYTISALSGNWRYDYFLAEGGHVRVEMQNNTERIDRLIEAFEKLYGIKPQAEDADGDFKIQVAQDMQMSLGGARYYIRLASERKPKEK